MKARIKKSGAIGDVIGTYMENDTKMVTFANGLTIPINEVDYIMPINEVDYIDEDWLSFRREAAKDFISGMLANVSPAANQWTTIEIVSAAIEIADELIKQLKQE